MIIFKKIKELRSYLDQQKEKPIVTGFVPTMGALHQGHISLISLAGETCQLVVASIFVNPTQFNDPKDFEKYPITIDKDINMLEAAGCDVLFLPSVAAMYPGGLKADKHYDLGYLETVLEGASRPGHFQGVCQVVERLLEIVQPAKLFVGQKDYQQCMVVKQLVQLMDIKTEIVIAPTQREQDGLAMSSRNMRLSAEARAKGPIIYNTLVWIKDTIEPGPVDGLVARALYKLENAGFTPDYVSIANAETLEPVDNWDGRTKLVALTAAFIDEVRLIDNLVL